LVQLQKTFNEKDEEFKENIKYGTLDLSSPYRAVYNEVLPHIT
jgi:hypothetical protein